MTDRFKGLREGDIVAIPEYKRIGVITSCFVYEAYDEPWCKVKDFREDFSRYFHIANCKRVTEEERVFYTLKYSE